jgi:hypothetical protein
LLAKKVQKVWINAIQSQKDTVLLIVTARPVGVSLGVVVFQADLKKLSKEAIPKPTISIVSVVFPAAVVIITVLVVAASIDAKSFQDYVLGKQ